MSTTPADDPSVSAPATPGTGTDRAPLASGAPASWGAPRSKTIEWYDPFAMVAQASTLSGREHLQGIMDGELPPPPISSHFDFVPVEIGDGMVVFRGVPDESAYNPIGLIHGGLMCTLLDTVVGCAVQTQLPVGVGYTSIDLNVSYLRPVHSQNGEVTATGRVTKPGRRVAFAYGELTDRAGKILATATSSLLILGGA